ncbi:hypothetical protein LCGC14_0467800 [marine sediment metagenome]|uniref:Uncharacterized protein n=1 Tax=marine sediment metagenome TaxID=412755 RepID=A0A0F9VM10_9ZZZZ|nr:BREX-3 system phosphatase PglZ [Methylophaga sp.]HEC58784.1 BREX-3 system phosphatase PglZ [Methylophaga sp.]
MQWQDRLLNKLALNESLCFVINDPDRICYEPHISNAIKQSKAIIFDDVDPIALHLIYEEWLEKESGGAFLFRYSDINEINIPYELLRKSKIVDFHISEVIEDIDADVLRIIPPENYQLISMRVQSYRPGKLTKVASLDFVLRHIYKIAPEIIQTDVDVVRMLIRKHYLMNEMPEEIEKHLIRLLNLNTVFSGWKFDQLIPYKPQFFEFLQQQWGMYLDSLLISNELKETAYPNHQLIVPFDDQDIKVFVDNLFADGLLKPIKFVGIAPEHWAWIGIQTDNDQTKLKRYQHLYDTVKKSLSKIDIKTVNADFWGELARGLGNLNAISYQIRQQLLALEIENLVDLNRQTDESFEAWLLDKYGELISIPSVQYPNMLHKIPSWLNQKVQLGKKVCLLVMDGMGFQQWALLRDKLNTCANIAVDERYCFAWVPTITSISRQALFSGKKPYYFADSLLTTAKEKALWTNYWDDQGLNREQVLYAKKVEDKINYTDFKDLIGSRNVMVAGLVINFIDEQMHGMKAGMSGLNSVVDDWLEQWQFTDKINILLDEGYEIIITADHGNQEAVGAGRLNEGVKAETKGERVRMYKSAEAAKSTLSSDNLNGKVINWPSKKYGLPNGFYPLVSRGCHAFVKAGQKIVGHGGIGLHEVIVPLAIIKRKNKHNVEKS